MKATRILSVALATSLMGTLGCAQNVPSATTQAPALPQLQTMTSGTVAPDQLLVGERQTLVNGQAMTVDQIRQQLPSRISAADAAKMLVKLDSSKFVEDNEQSVQQRFGRFGGFGRGLGGFGRGFYGRGFYGGYGRWGGFGGLGWRGFYGGLGYYPFGSYYFPYYYNAGYYYPYSYLYSGLNYWPYLYGFGGGYYPYSYCW